MARNKALGVGFAMLAVAVVSINLRSGIASLAPVLNDLAAEFGVGNVASGVLTALPGICFALMGWFAVPIAKRLGLTPTLFFGGVFLLVGISLRNFVGSYFPFMLLTVLLVAGIAVANILLPAWVKEHSSGKDIALLMMAYTALLGLSGAISPLSALFFDTSTQWRWALGVWVVPAVLQVFVWIFVIARIGKDVPSGGPVTADSGPQLDSVPMWKSATAVAMLLYFALQSSMAYVQMGWLPAMYIDKGISPTVASIALALLGGFNVIGGVTMPWIVTRFSNVSWLPVVFGVSTLAGWAGVWLAAESAPLLWGALLGLGGMNFPLILSMLTARTRSPLLTARLSGFVQPGGYLFAGMTPFLVGVVNQATGSWSPALILLVVMSALMIFMGKRAARDVFIDDEMAAARG